MAAFLLGQALAQGFHQLLETAHGFDLLLLFFGEEFLREFLQPLGGDLRREPVFQQFETFEDMPEHAVETVEIALVLHERRAREIVEILDAPAGEILLHRFHEREIFAQRHRDARGFQLAEEGDEHGRQHIPPAGTPVKRRGWPRRFRSRTGSHCRGITWRSCPMSAPTRSRDRPVSRSSAHRDRRCANPRSAPRSDDRR